MQNPLAILVALCAFTAVVAPAAATGGAACVDALYDLTTDAGARACVDADGECLAYVDSKFVWLPGTYCLLA